jgi:hypothetical protein
MQLARKSESAALEFTRNVRMSRSPDGGVTDALARRHRTAAADACWSGIAQNGETVAHYQVFKKLAWSRRYGSLVQGP